MKLVFFVKKISFGGVTTVMLNKLNYLANNFDHEIYIISENPGVIELERKFNTTIKIFCLNNQQINKYLIPFFGNFYRKYLLKPRYDKIIRKLKPDIISDYGWGSYTEIIPFNYKKIIKVRELHESFEFHTKGLKNKMIEEKIQSHNNYDVVVALTKKDLTNRTYLKTNKRVIHNPITKATKIKKYSERGKVILAVGAYIKRKNFIDLLEIWRDIHEAYPDWKIKIYGDGPERNFLEDFILNSNLLQTVELVKYSFDMDSVYNNAQVLISTALMEGFGMTMIEAHNYCIPVIAYDCNCGPSEIINDTIDGFIVPINNKEIMKSRLRNLLDSEILREKMSINSKLNAERFYVENIANQWNDFYININNLSKSYSQSKYNS